MRKQMVVWTVMACLAGFARAEVSAQEESGPSVSERLQALFNEDQRDRLEGLYSAAELAERDRQRRAVVDELLRAGGLRTANDFFNAAIIYQHGTDPGDYSIAAVLATAAGFRGHRLGRWLAAASLDRLLITVGQDQFFGTQFRYNEQNQWEPGTPHAFLNPVLRQIFEVESLEELQAMADEFNSGGVPQ